VGSQPTSQWYQPDSSEPVTTGQNNGIKIGYYERSISQTEVHKLLKLHSIPGVSGGTVNILGGGCMDYSE
jgi:hypothetical protein